MTDVRNSTTTVFVGCKLPNGLIMELVEPVTGRVIAAPAPIGRRFTLKGANSCLIQTHMGPVSAGTHQYGVTEVPKDFAEEWFKRYKGMEIVKRGQVFLLEKQDARSVKAETKERQDDPQTRTGLEPLAEKDPRLPGGLTKETPKVEEL